MVFYMPFYEDEELARGGPCTYTAGPIFRYHPDPVREGQCKIYVNAMSRLENGRDMIKKIYVLDGPDGYGALADVWKEKR
ncbi:MAG: hypothetical protein ACLTW9_18185 [Enterocloster sp.]